MTRRYAVELLFQSAQLHRHRRRTKFSGKGFNNFRQHASCDVQLACFIFWCALFHSELTRTSNDLACALALQGRRQIEQVALQHYLPLFIMAALFHDPLFGTHDAMVVSLLALRLGG